MASASREATSAVVVATDPVSDLTILMDCVERLISGRHPSVEDLDAVEYAIVQLVDVEDPLLGVDCHIVEYARYMAALGHLCLGNTSTADRHLGVLPLQHRLSTAVWQALLGRLGDVGPSPPVALEAASAPLPGNALAWDDALPPMLLDALRRGFAPKSTFWSQHRYDADDAAFFSYYYRLSDAPQNAVEHCVHVLWEQMKRSKVIPNIDHIVGVEWWAHKRYTRSSHVLSSCTL
jgi:hypothetical protein